MRALELMSAAIVAVGIIAIGAVAFVHGDRVIADIDAITAWGFCWLGISSRRRAS